MLGRYIIAIMPTGEDCQDIVWNLQVQRTLLGSGKCLVEAILTSWPNLFTLPWKPVCIAVPSELWLRNQLECLAGGPVEVAMLHGCSSLGLIRSHHQWGEIYQVSLLFYWQVWWWTWWESWGKGKQMMTKLRNLMTKLSLKLEACPTSSGGLTVRWAPNPGFYLFCKD